MWLIAPAVIALIIGNLLRKSGVEAARANVYQSAAALAGEAASETGPTWPLTPQHQAQRLANMNDRTSYVTSRGTYFRLQYELEDALARCEDLVAENARLHAEVRRLKQCDSDG